MKKNLLLLIFVGIYGNILAQQKLSFRLIDEESEQPVSYVQVKNLNKSISTISNENGEIVIQSQKKDSIQIRSLGYLTQTVLAEELINTEILRLSKTTNYLSEISVNANTVQDLGVQRIDKINLKLFPVNNAQDLLRTVNGLFIAQHAGGGKAEQIFMRGFDNDHGTDFGIFIDDIPINLSNHAHGQGYADMHFIIPELIQDADYYKGPYELENGNFSVSGAARYKTKNTLSKNALRLDIGQYGYQRGLAMLNLTPKNHLLSKNKYENAYVAIEGTLNRSFFNASQQFKKINAFFKYNVTLNEKTGLTVISSYFNSSWNASGQIPLRAVTNGTIDWYGAIDDTEGGSTSRANFSLRLKQLLKNKQQITHFAYYSNNQYQLFSNFTFFLIDTINGDMIDQNEYRDLFGYTLLYDRSDKLGKTNLSSTLSAGFRSDFVHLKRLKAIQRNPLKTVNNDKIQELNSWVYYKANWKLSRKWTALVGTRFDHFLFAIQDQLNENKKGNKATQRLSPKVSIFYNPTPTLQFFAKAGYGFHSNYAHAAINDPTIHPLPRAQATDLGTNFKIRKRFIGSAALWAIKSDAEYLFVPDGGEFENNGSAFRYGVDIAAKFQPIDQFWIDGDVNYSIGKLLAETEGENSIPSAPRLTYRAGLMYRSKFGLDVLLTSRYMARRPLVEDESVWADAYFLLDASVNYKLNERFQLNLSAQNILNQKWMEAVFYDTSQLLDEPEPVDDFHFTPGTPLFIKGALTYSF